MKRFTERNVYNHLYCKIFNTNVYELFPELGECINEDYFIVTGFLEDFLIDLFDLSKPIVKPFLDERSTYIYRSLYGIGNLGIAKSVSSLANELSLSRERIGQLVKYADTCLINMFITEYKYEKDRQSFDYICLEELNLPRRVYNALKRLGINSLSDIDLSTLKDQPGIGDSLYKVVEDTVIRVRK